MNSSTLSVAPPRAHWHSAVLPWLFGTRRRIFIVGVLALALIGLLDWQTGPNVVLSGFYLLPAGILAWFFGRRVGFLVAFVNAAIWLVLDLETNFHIADPLLYWNTIMRLLTLMVMVHIIVICRNFADEVERLVTVRTADLQRELTIRQESESAIRAMGVQLSAAEDAERRQLGQDLHDTVGQSLSVLKLQLDAFSTDNAATHAHVRAWSALVDNVLHQTRTLNFELYPSMLDELGLLPTLRWYASQLESQTAVSVAVGEGGTPQQLTPALAGFLFRATKELMTNSLKHGGAGEICVQLRWRANELRVIVDDDGKGFSTHGNGADGRAGLGLAWVGERARSLRGELRLESAVGAGTRVLLEIPIAGTGGQERNVDDARLTG